MTKFLLFLVLSVSLGGCNLGCKVETAISNGLSGGIARTLSCTNQSVIQTDVTNVLNLTKICAVAECVEKRKTGMIANLVCPIVAVTAVTYLGNQVPVAWGCQTGAAEQTVGAVVTQACELLPF